MMSFSSGYRRPEICMCGMDYKRGTIVFATVLCTLSCIYLVAAGIGLKTVIDYEESFRETFTEVDVQSLKTILTALLIIYGLHTLCCGLVILAASVENRLLLIPWMIIGGIILGMAIYNIGSTIQALIKTELDTDADTSVAINPLFLLIGSIFTIILIVSFAWCIYKLYVLLKNMARVQQDCHTNNSALSQPFQREPVLINGENSQPQLLCQAGQPTNLQLYTYPQSQIPNPQYEHYIPPQCIGTFQTLSPQNFHKKEYPTVPYSEVQPPAYTSLNF